jgi:hypothetical protein
VNDNGFCSCRRDTCLQGFCAAAPHSIAFVKTADSNDFSRLACTGLLRARIPVLKNVRCCDLDRRHFAEHGPEQRELLAVVELGLYPLRVRKTSD